MFSIKERFGNVFKNENYTLVNDKSNIELFIGLNSEGRKTLKLRGSFSQRQIKGTNSIEIVQFSHQNNNIIDFTLIDDKLDQLFYLFCEDIAGILSNTNDNQIAYQMMIMRFFHWKKFFSSGSFNILSEIKIMGLIGEIYFLKNYLFNLYGQSKAIKGWTGQDLTHKDFSYDNTWYEIKSISVNSKVAKISSLEQLDSKVKGELVVIFLEKMSPQFQGVSLNKMVKETVETIKDDIDKELFLEKVSLQGFFYNEEYDNFVYSISNKIRYLIDDSFPKLVAEGLNEAIVAVQYDLSLKEISKYQIKE